MDFNALKGKSRVSTDLLGVFTHCRKSTQRKRSENAKSPDSNIRAKSNRDRNIGYRRYSAVHSDRRAYQASAGRGAPTGMRTPKRSASPPGAAGMSRIQS